MIIIKNMFLRDNVPEDITKMNREMLKETGVDGAFIFRHGALEGYYCLIVNMGK